MRNFEFFLSRRRPSAKADVPFVAIYPVNPEHPCFYLRNSAFLACLARGQNKALNLFGILVGVLVGILVGVLVGHMVGSLVGSLGGNL